MRPGSALLRSGSSSSKEKVERLKKLGHCENAGSRKCELSAAQKSNGKLKCSDMLSPSKSAIDLPEMESTSRINSVPEERDRRSAFVRAAVQAARRLCTCSQGVGSRVLSASILLLDPFLGELRKEESNSRYTTAVT
jgi:hypothetical protein